MATIPEAVLEIKAGIKKEFTDLSELYPPPAAVNALQLSSNHSTPPIPEPIIHPNRV